MDAPYVEYLCSTVEPLNNGHIDTFSVVLITETHKMSNFSLSIIGGCPYFGVSLMAVPLYNTSQTFAVMYPLIKLNTNGGST